VEVLRKRKEGQDETQFTTKIDGLPSFNPRWTLMYFFAGFFQISPTPCMIKLRFWCPKWMVFWVSTPLENYYVTRHMDEAMPVYKWYSCGRWPCCQFPNVNTWSTPYAWPWVNLASTLEPWLKPVIINSIGYRNNQ
jgi:hypothetical protein